MGERIIEIEQTADGSNTLYLPSLDEHYHSIKGALTESRHIYRDCALLHCPKSEIRLLEIGFGTGLNALVSALATEKTIEYHTLELYPLAPEIIERTRYADILGCEAAELYRAIHAAQWDTPVAISDKFKIFKHHCDLTLPETELPGNIDVVYYDAFAPEKQPEMWTLSVMQRIYATMAPGATLTTYCAKGEIRRRLASLPMTVERIAGRIAGKREILRATKP
ncbi:MAG: tRNA (5-methylaminomethyl-2-thiouridine)(34)-methyltransferase MnmD [Muribaculaceae bacterium]|nr:tRNA (5-methylaminomethyl-2-thiouridine)(34)-methyltransferase MnmD [Muribaculaceae bacterium]